MVSGFQTLGLYAPEFVEYLKRFPAYPLAEVDNFVYWSKEKAGFKPVTSLTHVSIYRKAIQGRTSYFIASKQIYATHYFEGSMGLSVISEGAHGDCWLVYINRSRNDVLRGWLTSLRRAIIQSELRSGMRKQLEATKKKLETKFRTGL